MHKNIQNNLQDVVRIEIDIAPLAWILYWNHYLMKILILERFVKGTVLQKYSQNVGFALGRAMANPNRVRGCKGYSSNIIGLSHYGTMALGMSSLKFDKSSGVYSSRVRTCNKENRSAWNEWHRKNGRNADAQGRMKSNEIRQFPVPFLVPSLNPNYSIIVPIPNSTWILLTRLYLFTTVHPVPPQVPPLRPDTTLDMLFLYPCAQSPLRSSPQHVVVDSERPSCGQSDVISSLPQWGICLARA